jgi:3-hydroxybutyryl-CoA dehydratase
MEKPRSCKTVADLKVGDRVEKQYVISDEDVEAFARVSGDYNPLHFDDEYAASTIFGKRIAHGLISLAKFSGIFGMDMPGLGTLWLSQKVEFRKPVFIGHTYAAIAEVTNIDRRRATIATWVEDAAGIRVLEGEAIVLPITAQAKAKLGNS